MQKHMENRIKYFVTGFIFTLLLGLGGMSSVTIKATSATLTFTAESRSVSVGDTFYVVLIVDSGENIGGFEGYISYDSSLAEFITGGSYVNGGDGLLRINDIDSAEVQSTKKYSLKFKAKKTGECTFDTSEAPAVYNENGDNLSVSSNKLTISIGKSQSLSRNTKLSKLLISPGELNQEYRDDITAYKTEIPYENDMLFISAVPEDSNAVVTVEGNEGLKVGTNYVHIVVTAQSGDKKDIQIEVKRLGEGQEAKKEEEVVTGVVITKNEEGKLVIKDVHTYQAAELTDDTVIPAGYEASTITLDGQELPAYVLSNDTENEFLLLYLTNEKGETGFYQYDRIEKTIQRFIYEKEEPAVPGIEKEDSTSLSPSFLIILVMAVVIIILGIALSITILKNRNDKLR